jgi:hypothetical protein
MRTLIGDISLRFDTDGAGLVASGDAMVERMAIVVLHGGPGFDHSTLKPEFQVLYNGLGGLGGAILAGPTDFVAPAKVWQTRHGGMPVFRT